MLYTYVNEDQIDIELKCMICRQPYQSPVNCIKCGQTFCQSCIDTWRKDQLSCPSCRENGYTFVPVLTRIVLNQLNRLLVQCSLCQQTNIERSNFSDHIYYSCPKQIITCIDKCGWKGYREDFEQHPFHCRKKRLGWSKFIRWLNCFKCIKLIH